MFTTARITSGRPTREGVEKIDESKRLAPATDKQRQLIKKILSDFPNSKSSLEYEDYRKEKTVGAASEFITRALEENADEMLNTKTYEEYSTYTSKDTERLPFRKYLMRTVYQDGTAMKNGCRVQSTMC